jgi:putative autoinducer-2 (AI-2) aldolase
VVPPTLQQGFVVRASGGPSILKELSNEQLAMDVDDALRLGASAMAVQVYIGGEFETQTVHNMTRLVDEGYKRGMPVLGVTAVGKDLARDARYIGLATRICAELGAQVVKTYYCAEGFEKVTAGCPVPIVMAGGKKLPELEALQMAHNAISQGAAGVDMGRNIFQSDAPIAMLRAVRAVVHDGFTPRQAFDVYETVRREAVIVAAGV